MISYQTYWLEMMVSEHQSEIASADDKITDLSARSDGYWTSAEGLQLQMIRYRSYRPEVMVTRHQPEIANEDDKISALSARGDGFGASTEGFCKCR